MVHLLRDLVCLSVAKIMSSNKKFHIEIKHCSRAPSYAINILSETIIHIYTSSILCTVYTDIQLSGRANCQRIFISLQAQQVIKTTLYAKCSKW